MLGGVGIVFPPVHVGGSLEIKLKTSHLSESAGLPEGKGSM